MNTNKLRWLPGGRLLLTENRGDAAFRATNTASNKSAVHAMQALKVLLLDRFLRNDSYIGPGYCFAVRFGIVGVILLGPDVWLDELWSISRTVCPIKLSTRFQW